LNILFEKNKEELIIWFFEQIKTTSPKFANFMVQSYKKLHYFE